jgi:DNA-directed RNA polymerase specialized sigma24 family protein
MTREVYGQAYQRGFDLTVRFLLSRGVQRDSAREVAQAAWVRAWERLTQLRDDNLVVTWVNTIALNVYRGLIRKELLNQSLADLRETRDHTVAIDMAAIDVNRLLRICRPSDRQLLEQSMCGVTSGEIARQQGVSETAIRIRLLRARRYARSRLEAKPAATRGRQAFAVTEREAA